MKEKEDIYDFVYNYPKKNDLGFTTNEVRSLLKELKIDKRTYNSKFGVNTCSIIDGEIIYYPIDVYTTIICCIEKRDKTLLEFD